MVISTQFPPRVTGWWVTVTQREAFPASIQHRVSGAEVWDACGRCGQIWAPRALRLLLRGPTTPTFLMALGRGHSRHHATPAWGVIFGTSPSWLLPGAWSILAHSLWGRGGAFPAGPPFTQVLWVLSEEFHLLELLQVLLAPAGRDRCKMRTTLQWNFATGRQRRRKSQDKRVVQWGMKLKGTRFGVRELV